MAKLRIVRNIASTKNSKIDNFSSRILVLQIVEILGICSLSYSDSFRNFQFRSFEKLSIWKIPKISQIFQFRKSSSF